MNILIFLILAATLSQIADNAPAERILVAGSNSVPATPTVQCTPECIRCGNEREGSNFIEICVAGFSRKLQSRITK